jgi:hypothetical protein
METRQSEVCGISRIMFHLTKATMIKSSPIKMTFDLPFMTLKGRERCSRALFCFAFYGVARSRALLESFILRAIVAKRN